PAGGPVPAARRDGVGGAAGPRFAATPRDGPAPRRRPQPGGSREPRPARQRPRRPAAVDAAAAADLPGRDRADGSDPRDQYRGGGERAGGPGHRDAPISVGSTRRQLDRDRPGEPSERGETARGEDAAGEQSAAPRPGDRGARGDQDQGQLLRGAVSAGEGPPGA